MGTFLFAGHTRRVHPSVPCFCVQLEKKFLTKVGNKFCTISGFGFKQNSSQYLMENCFLRNVLAKQQILNTRTAHLALSSWSSYIIFNTAIYATEKENTQARATHILGFSYSSSLKRTGALMLQTFMKQTQASSFSAKSQLVWATEQHRAGKLLFMIKQVVHLEGGKNKMQNQTLFRHIDKAQADSKGTTCRDSKCKG